MRYFCYSETGGERGEKTEYITMSETEIIEEYWDDWYYRMCLKCGKEKVDGTWGFEDFLDEWVIDHRAWEVKE